MEENINTTILTPAILSSISSMKRSELQKLCKKYGLKANGKNTDLQKKIKQYALNSEGSTKDMEDIEMMDIDRSSSRNQYADSVSEPTTPQTPSAIPLEQQNKVRSSLVDDSPINIKTSESFAGDLVPMEQCLALIPYKEFIFSDLVKEQDENIIDDVNIQKLTIDTDQTDDTLKVAEMRINEPLVSGEKNDLNTIVSNPVLEQVETNSEKNDLNTIVSKPLNPVLEQVEANKPPVMANTPLKSSSNFISIEPQTPPSKHIRSLETERASTNFMARLTATPVLKCGGANSLPGSCYENKTGPALDKNSPFITRETKLNFETMQNSLLIQEKENREDTENEGDPMDICDEQLKTTETTDVSLSNSEIINITASIYKELDDRVAQLKALPTPERKKILGMDNVKTEIPTITPFRKNSESSLIKQTSSSSVNRFTQVHEKVFSKMPSIVTHYAAQRTKKVEETQDEINRKRKDPDDSQSSFKKQKLVHSIQDNQVTKAAKDIYKKVEKDKETVKPVMKRTYDRNRTTSNIRSSIRLNLAKGKNASQVEPSARTSSNVQESQRKQLSYVQRRGPVKSIIPNPDEQRKKKREELEKRKQAARNVAQPVLEKMKNQRKSKENIEQKQKESQITQNGKIKEKKSLLPKRAK